MRTPVVGESLSPNAVVTPPFFMAFDCLYARGRELRAPPLWRCRLALEQEIEGQDPLLTARRLRGNGLNAWKEVQRRGYEGLVAKDEASRYC